MERFFPPALTSERRKEIIAFKQEEEESLYNAWERYKKLLKRCPMHVIDQITQMDIFYHAMNYSSKGIIDATCYGAFKMKSTKEANQFIEDLAKSNYRAPSETSGSYSILRGGGIIELNKMSTIKAKLDALMRKVNNQKRRNHSANAVGIEKGGEQKCIVELATFQTNTNVFQVNINASLKNLKSQVGQLALNMQNQSRDSFPSDTKKNPNNYMEITLKSGRELQQRKKR